MPDFGDGSPRENYGTYDPNAPSVQNGQITPEQWAEYQRKRRRAEIIGYLTTIGGMGAAGLAGSAISGGGGAAAGSAEAGGLPAGMLPGGSMISTTFPADALIGSGTAVGAGAGAGAGVGAGAGTGAGAGAGAGAAKGVLGGLTTRDLIALGLTGAGVAGSALSPSPNMNPTTATNDPNMQRLIATMQGRLDKSEPLYDSIMRMANGLLPTQYQKGGGGMP